MTVRKSWIEKLCAAPRKFAVRWRQRGPGDACGWAWYQLQWRFREWQLGARTSEFAHGLVVESDGEQLGYEPIDYLCFDQMMDYLQPITPSDGFLDYGCGMGRGVFLAGMQPYGIVLGIELHPQLAQVGNQMLSRLRAKGKLRAKRVEILEQDAAQFEVPAEINHVFLFNSFTGNVLQQTLNQIRRSLEKFPRMIKMVYLQPREEENPLAQVHWLRHEADLPTGYWTHIRSVVYSTDVPKSEGSR
ncbi:MAG TPA: class I SAM-dependent methyltransferase [Pirellulaceae bacterium]|nr:class I SAM-dependent methyltransferase [Pirellulaceae bacterium]